MKLEVAIQAAKKISNQDKVIMAVVEEGIHADEFAEMPSYGYCPLSAVQTLYKYGKVVTTVGA